MNAALRRFSRRQIRTRPGRALLTLISIVLGVAAISAVEMLAVSVRHASGKMFETIAGRAALTIQAAADAPIEEELTKKVAAVEGVLAAVPIIQRSASITTRPNRPKSAAEESAAEDEEPEVQRTRGMVLGVDPSLDTALRDQEIAEGVFFTAGTPPAATDDEEEESLDEVVLEQNFAKARHVQVGDEIKILAGGLFPHTLKVVGLVRNTSYARASAGGMAYLKLETAQKFYFKGEKQVTSIQVVLKEGEKIEAAAERINQILPEGLTAASPAARTAVLQQTLNPTEQGLNVAVVFVTLLAAFIVFNTFMMNVSERRRQLAILRAIGSTRAQISSILVREALFLGLIGTLLGLLVGWRGTVWATFIIGGALEVDFPPAQFTWLLALKASIFGLGISLLGVIYPAWQASKLTPLEAMSTASPTDEESTPYIPILIGGSLILVGAVFLLFTMQGIIDITWSVYPALIILIGLVVLAETLLIRPVSALVAMLIQPLFGPTAALARRQIVRNQTRSALTSGVLFIAAATGIGLSWVILDTVKNAEDWLKRTIIGNYYIRVALPDFASGESPETPEEFDQRLDALEPRRLTAKREKLISELAEAKTNKPAEVARIEKDIEQIAVDLKNTPLESIDRARIVKTKIKGIDTMVGAREFPTVDHASFELIEGTGITQIYQEMMADHDRRVARAADAPPDLTPPPVVVSSVVAQKADIKAGDIVPLTTPDGERMVKVVGINNEYLVGGLLVWMQRAAAEDLLHISGYDGYVIMTRPDRVEEARTVLEPMANDYGLLLQSFAEIQTTVSAIIRSSDFMLWGLVIVEFVVASFGMVNTLTMSVLEQTRELGMLRIIAMTRAQVRRTILAQAIIIGLMGIVPGMLVGLLIAYLMNLATFASIAHPVQFGFHPWLVIGTFFAAMSLIITSAFVPAYRASRINVLKALQYE